MDSTHKLQLCSNLALLGFHRSTVCCEKKKAEIYKILIYPLLVCVSLCIYLHFRKLIRVFHKIEKYVHEFFRLINTKKNELALIYGLLVVLRHIHRYFMYMCAGGQKKVDLRLGSQTHAIEISQASFRCLFNTDTGPFCQSFHAPPPPPPPLRMILMGKTATTVKSTAPMESKPIAVAFYDAYGDTKGLSF